ncbi:MAG: T9SS type A sorting domain-containing protein [Chitinophagaceae bacterium]|nr:T9SS type A sorting domain-containing protein [Chitinophagaceae bacterium]
MPRCQVVNIPVTVSNVKWGTNFESPTLCFGSISDFEYQLPNGWSIGANVSNGSNWIPGGNSVTVTSDLANGVNGVILVRPRNTCGTGLQNNQTPGQIPISRPEPNLQITSSDGRFYVCSGTRDFTLTNVPSGASIQWELLSTANATISGANNQSTVTIQRNTSSNTTVGLKATVTHCSFSYERNQTVVLGSGVSDFTFTSLYNTVSTINGYPEAFVWATVTNVPQALNYNWYYKKHTGSGPGGGTGGTFTWIGTTASYHNEFTLPECDENYTIKVEVGTSCGTEVTPVYEGLLYADCSGSFMMSVSPNPTTDLLNVNIGADNKNERIEQFEIIDKMGNIVQKGKGNNSKRFQINVSSLKQGQHILRIFNGKIWSSKIFIKQ